MWQVHDVLNVAQASVLRQSDAVAASFARGLAGRENCPEFCSYLKPLCYHLH